MRIVAGMWVVAGCGPPTFFDKYAQALCEHEETCDPEAFDAAYRSPRDCRTEQRVALDEAGVDGRCDVEQEAWDTCIRAYVLVIEDCETDDLDVIEGLQVCAGILTQCTVTES